MIHLPPSCAREFRPIRLLASGGFGSVILAHQVGLDREVVIKLLHSGSRQSPEQIAKFLAEARITALLEHPNIVRLIGAHADEGIPWIAYEYIDGETVADLIQAGALPGTRAVDLGIQVGRALNAAHARRIFHRDIKAENVLRARSGEFKVIDFGIARWQSDQGIRTAQGIIYGTVEYMPPEYIGSGQFDARSDIYSLGVLLYRVMAGRLPFEGESVQEVLRQHLKVVPPRLRSIDARIPARVEGVVERMLEKDPGARFSDCDDLLSTLTAIRDDMESMGLGLVDSQHGMQTTAHRGGIDAAKPPLQAPGPSRTVAVPATMMSLPRRSRYLAWSLLLLSIPLVSGLWLAWRVEIVPRTFSTRFEARERGLEITVQGSDLSPLELVISVGGQVSTTGIGSDHVESSFRWSQKNLESNLPYLAELRDRSTGERITRQQGQTPPGFQLGRVSVFPADTWVLIDFFCDRSDGLEVLIRPQGEEGPPIRWRAPDGSSVIHERIPGLRPDQPYELCIQKAGSWGGVEGHGFRTRPPGSRPSLRLSELDLGKASDLFALAAALGPHERSGDPRILDELKAYPDKHLRRGDLDDEVLKIVVTFRDQGLLMRLVPDVGKCLASTRPERRFNIWCKLLWGRHPGALVELPRISADDGETDVTFQVAQNYLAESVDRGAGPVVCDLIATMIEKRPAIRSSLEAMVRADEPRARKHFERWLEQPERKGLEGPAIYGLALLREPQVLSKIKDLARKQGENPAMTWGLLGLAQMEVEEAQALGRELLRDFDGLRSRTWLLRHFREDSLIPDFLQALEKDPLEVRFVTDAIPILDPDSPAMKMITAKHRAALLGLALIGGQRDQVFSTQIEYLKDPRPELARLACWSLASLGCARSGKAILEHFFPRDETGVSAWALGTFRSEFALDRLIEQAEKMNGQDEKIRQVKLALTSWALGQIDPGKSRSILEKIRDSSRNATFSRDQARRALETGREESGVFRFFAFPFVPCMPTGVHLWPEQSFTVSAQGFWGPREAPLVPLEDVARVGPDGPLLYPHLVLAGRSLLLADFGTSPAHWPTSRDARSELVFYVHDPDGYTRIQDLDSGNLVGAGEITIRVARGSHREAPRSGGSW